MSPVHVNICIQERASLSRGMMDNPEYPALPHLVPLHSALGELEVP